MQSKLPNLLFGGRRWRAAGSAITSPRHDATPMTEVTPSDADATCLRERCSLEWTDVSFSVRLKKGGTKQILSSTTGSVAPGKVLAVMGPSGSGKTTLLDALAGRLKRNTVSGQITFGGAKLSDGELQRVASYVAQEDSLMGAFTVAETLGFAVRFNFGYSMPSAEFHRRVREAASTIGLADAMETRVGDIFFKGLSGGQRRRLSLGVELVKKPSVLLIDEATSGLDSCSAFGVMSQLNALARQGHTVLTTIHQPSSEIWALFDTFLLLSRGQPLYFGPASETVAHFAKLGHVCPQYSNPADFVVGLVNTDFPTHAAPDIGTLSAGFTVGDTLLAEIKSSRDASAHRRGKGSAGKALGPLSDFVTLSKRNMFNNIRNPGIYWVRFGMYVMLSLMIGLMYHDLGKDKSASSITARVSVLFYVAAFLVFMAVAVLPFFIMERAVFLRERGNGCYGVPAYALSNLVCSIPGLVLIALASTACIVPLSGLNHFGTYFLTLAASLFTSEAVMYLIGSVAPHYIIGIAAGAGMFGFFMLCEGFFIVKDDIPPWFIWAHHIAFHTYSFRAFMVNEFQSIAAFDAGAPFPSGLAVLEFYGMADVNIPRDIGVLLGIGALFHLMYAAVLQWVQTGRR